jgi:HK97 family phage prohead protease/HK97 family phage major capsid protein
MPDKLKRSLRFDHSKIDAKNRTIELSVSSDTGGVVRYICGMGEVREILGHEDGEISLYRFDSERGGPLLYNHDFNELIGRFTVTGQKGGKLRGIARLGNSPRAEQVWRDIQDGIIADVSITYDYNPKDTKLIEAAADGRPAAVRVTNWTLFEVSFVTVPADPTVGIGRSLCGKKDEAPEDEDEDEDEDRDEDDAETEDCSEDDEKPESDEDDTETSKSAKKSKKSHKPQFSQHKEQRMETVTNERVTKILELADRFNVTAEKRNQWIADGATVSHVRKELLDGFSKTAKAMPASESIGMTKKDHKNYSIANALRFLVTNDPQYGGLEREVSKALAVKLGRNTGGLLIPNDIRVRNYSARATHNTTDATDQPFVFQQYMGYLEMLKNQAVVLQMGARLITGLQGNPTWVRQTGTSKIFWVNENPPVDVTESNLDFDLVTSTPKTAKSLLSYTRQQVLQSIEAFEPIVNQDLLENDALAVDTAALQGTGGGQQPTGLLNTPGISPLALGTNGLKPIYENITRLKTLVKRANTLSLGAGGYLTTPEIEDLLQVTPKMQNAIAMPIWEDDKVAGYPAVGANQVPDNLSKGTSINNCHAIIFGIWSELLILEWGALEMVVDPYTQAARDIVRVTTSHLLDVFVRRPKAFAAIKDALAS